MIKNNQSINGSTMMQYRQEYSELGGGMAQDENNPNGSKGSVIMQAMQRSMKAQNTRVAITSLPSPSPYGGNDLKKYAKNQVMNTGSRGGSKESR